MSLGYLSFTLNNESCFLLWRTRGCQRKYSNGDKVFESESFAQPESQRLVTVFKIRLLTMSNNQWINMSLSNCVDNIALVF